MNKFASIILSGMMVSTIMISNVNEEGMFKLKQQITELEQIIQTYESNEQYLIDAYYSLEMDALAKLESANQIINEKETTLETVEETLEALVIENTKQQELIQTLQEQAPQVEEAQSMLPTEEIKSVEEE